MDKPRKTVSFTFPPRTQAEAPRKNVIQSEVPQQRKSHNLYFVTSILIFGALLAVLSIVLFKFLSLWTVLIVVLVLSLIALALIKHFSRY